MRHGLSWLAVAVAGLATSAARAETSAAPAPLAATDTPAEPVLLGSIERVRELCLALRPADRVLFPGDEAAQSKARTAHEASRQSSIEARYRARLPSGSFRFNGYNERDGRLVVDLSRPMRTLHGAVTLTSRTAEAGFPMAIEAAGSVPGFTMLDVTFTLDASLPCSGSVGVGKFRLSVVPSSLDLLDRAGQPLAHVDLTAPVVPATP